MRSLFVVFGRLIPLRVGSLTSVSTEARRPRRRTPMFVFHDVLQIEEAEARKVENWVVRVLTQAALLESRARVYCRAKIHLTIALPRSHD
jgi:hypothetical protein